MKKKTQRNCKKGGSRSRSRSGSRSSDSSVGYEKFKTENPEIMTVYKNANKTKGSLALGIAGSICTIGLVIFALHKRK